MNFEWQSVNKQLPQKHFDYDDFRPAPGAYVVDYRSGEPVVVRVVGKDRSVSPTGLEAIRPGGRTAALRIVVVISSAVLLITVLVLLVRRPRAA